MSCWHQSQPPQYHRAPDPPLLQGLSSSSKDTSTRDESHFAILSIPRQAYCTLATAFMLNLYWSPGSTTLTVIVNFPLLA